MPIVITLPSQGSFGAPIVFVLPGREIPGMSEAITLKLRELDRDVHKGYVADFWCGPLGTIPAALLELHYDPLCRSYSGMSCALKLMGKTGLAQETVTAIVIAKKPIVLSATPAEVKKLTKPCEE